MLRKVEPLVIVDSIREAVSLSEVKAQCRITDNAEDTLLALYIQAARRYVERQANITIHEKTLELVAEYWLHNGCRDYIELPGATPLISVLSVKYKDKDGNETTWPNTEYLANTDEQPGRLVPGYGKFFPAFVPYPVSPIRIQYKAGIVTKSPPTEASAQTKLPILMLMGALYENREASTVPDQATIGEIVMRYGFDAFIDAIRVRGQYAEL